ncbi:restriction endonuclease subunit S [Arthrobacter sp. 1P04PC]|uniref:restriction endonuclease subunit S n=1 Tax=unclassified Arthrobacter TaxID=235627 RepID=UPI0039A3179C
MTAPNPYPEYKDSGAEWLGAVPNTWGVQPLWTLFRRSKRLGSGEEELLSVYRDYGVIPKSSRDDNHNRASEDLSKYQFVNVGDLVINKMKAWQGSVAVSEFEGIVSPAYFVFRSLSNHDLRYLHYLLRSGPYIGAYASISKGVRPSQWDLDPEKHRVLPVLLPSVGEQQAIASYLDHEAAEIDAFIADQEELIELLNERRAATITQAVTKGLDLTVKMKDSGVPWIGKVPQHWVVDKGTRIGKVFGSEMIKEEDINEVSGTQFLKVSSLSVEGFSLQPTRWFVERYAAAPITNFIVFPKRGAAIFTNKVNIVKEPAFLDPNLMGWKPYKDCDSKFFAYVLQLVKLEEIADVSTVPQINTKHIASLRLPKPSLAEQQEIVDYLDFETSEIDAAIADAKEAIELSKERRAALISAAVTGKIDVRDHITAGLGAASYGVVQRG